MRPMFSYFGSKWMLAKKYGQPKYNVVIEPFAGSAAYSLYWNVSRAILFDKNEQIIGIWNYLIHTTESEIQNLPIDFEHVDDLKIVQEAKWLIGYWIKKASVTAGKSRTAWARQYRHSGDCKVWSEQSRQRIASQLKHIRKWSAKMGDYKESPDIEATWFIDPPYEKAGKNYLHNQINYEDLSLFCRQRLGQIFVCENNGATWLPFRPLALSRGTFGHKRTGISDEVVYP